MKHRLSNKPTRYERKQSAIYYCTESDAAETRIMRRMESTYTWMFMEDLSHVIPPGITDDNYREKILVIPENDAVTSILADGFSISHDNYRQELGYPFSEFVRLLMMELYSNDTVSYEIVRLFEAGKDTPSAFQLFHLNPSQLKRGNGHLIQIVPPEIAEQRKVGTEIPLPDEDIVTFSLPKKLRKQIAKACEHLDLVSLRESTDIYMRSTKEKFPYNFGDHTKAMYVAIAAATEPMGWNGRGLLHEKTLPTFWLKREIQHHRFNNCIRQTLIDQFNDFLSRIGPRFGFSAQLRLEGFLSETELSVIEDHIEKGDVPMINIVDMLSSRKPIPNAVADTVSK